MRTLPNEINVTFYLLHFFARQKRQGNGSCHSGLLLRCQADHGGTLTPLATAIGCTVPAILSFSGPPLMDVDVTVWLIYIVKEDGISTSYLLA